ncbi:MAG: hypothetical protein ACYTCV_11825 [Planctomycetota bacterium]|jgi:hypothetical protein
MARKKKTTRKKTGGFGGFFSKTKKRRKTKNRPSFATGVKVALTILFLTVLVGGGAVGLIYLDRYVKAAAADEIPEGTVVFKKPPTWLNQEWKDWIQDVLGSAAFPLDTHSAQIVSGKLKPVAWFKDLTVQTEPNGINVYAAYRRPVGLISSGKKKLYIGDDMAVMNYIPMAAIPVIEIKGASTKAPEPGQVWLAEDAKAAVELLNLLYRIDQLYQQDTGTSTGGKIPEKPLLNEIDSIDVSNFAGRQSRSHDKPQIVLNVKDGTKVYWGAAWGQAANAFEADEKTKLDRLYQWFMEHNNSLQGTVKIIELRWLQDSIPRPR